MSLLETSPITFVSPAVLAGDDPAANPCLDCGACCSHFRVSFYCGELAGENGGQVPVELVTQLSACMKGTEMGGGRCISLRGELGKPGIHCAIYENRPTPCREFDIWLPDGTPNPDCQRLRLALACRRCRRAPTRKTIHLARSRSIPTSPPPPEPQRYDLPAGAPSSCQALRVDARILHRMAGKAGTPTGGRTPACAAGTARAMTPPLPALERIWIV